jgi:hypothetical protein
MWQPYLLMDQDKMNKLYNGPSIDTSYQISVHSAKHFVPIHLQTWPPQAILVSDWPISKKSSSLQLCQMNGNMVGSIYERASIKIANFIPIG